MSVLLPGYAFATSVLAFDDASSKEPGQNSAHLLGAPTDITFTIPGANGPDGGDGDGSIQIKVGGFVTLDFGGPLTAPFGNTDDIIVFTDTAGGGFADFELLGADLSTVAGSLTGVQVPSDSATGGMGGVILDVVDDTTFGGIRWTVVEAHQARGGEGRRSVEIDAVAAIPEPASALLLGLSVIGLATLRRAR